MDSTNAMVRRVGLSRSPVEVLSTSGTRTSELMGILGGAGCSASGDVVSTNSPSCCSRPLLCGRAPGSGGEATVPSPVAAAGSDALFATAGPDSASMLSSTARTCASRTRWSCSSASSSSLRRVSSARRHARSSSPVAGHGDAHAHRRPEISDWGHDHCDTSRRPPMPAVDTGSQKISNVNYEGRGDKNGRHLLWTRSWRALHSAKTAASIAKSYCESFDRVSGLQRTGVQGEQKPTSHSHTIIHERIATRRGSGTHGERAEWKRGGGASLLQGR